MNKQFRFPLWAFIIIQLVSFTPVAHCQNYTHYIGSSEGLKTLMDFIRVGEECSLVLQNVHQEDLTGEIYILKGKIGAGGRVTAKTKDERVEISFYLNNRQISGLGLETNGISQRLPDLSENWSEGSVPFKIILKKAEQALFPVRESPVARMDVSYPEPRWMPSQTVNDSLHAAIFRLFFEKQRSSTQNAAEYMDQLIASFKNSYISDNQSYYSKESSASLNWIKELDFYILNNDRYLLSLCKRSYAYTGGAHGMEVKKFMNFNMKLGRELTLQDVFQENQMETLRSLIKNKLMESFAEESHNSLTDAGFFQDSVPLTENFYLTTFGVGFHYNPYEIAPYAFGSPEVFLKRDEINIILKEGRLP